MAVRKSKSIAASPLFEKINLERLKKCAETIKSAKQAVKTSKQLAEESESLVQEGRRRRNAS